MTTYEKPFSFKAVSFLENHLLIVYIATVVTATLVVAILQILGVHE